MNPNGARSAESTATRAYSLAAMPPQVFGKYTLIGRLGHGGMAEVNLAVSEGKGGFRKLVVIKKLHRHLAMEPGFIEMFLDEARLAARLNHPHAVQTYEVGESDGNHFIAMEYLDGQGLERLLRMSGEREEVISVELAARMISDALDGLAYAHELTDFDGTALNVVHRDISPQNIFVTYNGMVKLLDFGIAKAATHVVETKTGVIKGKYAYIAPEQALGADVDQRSDLWSMGVVLWEVLTGRRLFKSANELATLHETLQGDIKLPSAFRPDLPTDLDTICMRALQRDPNDRYQSAQEMKDDLDRYLQMLPKAPGRRHIGRLMKDRFAEVIDLHKTTLAACLKGSDQSVTSSAIDRLVAPASISGIHANQSGMTPTPTPTPSPAPVSVTPPPGLPSVTPPPMATSAPRPQEGGGWMWKAALILLVILLAAVAALLLPLGQPDEITVGALPDREDGTAEQPVPEVGGDVVQLPSEPGMEAARNEAPQADGVADTTEQPPAEEEVEAPTEEEVEADRQASRTPEQIARLRAARERRQRERREREARQAQEREEAATPPPAEEPGRLTLATTPWTHVYLGSRDLGTTPIVNVELPAGTHALRLVNREAGIEQTYRVTIRPGQRLSRRLGLR